MTHEELQSAISHQIIVAPPFALGGYIRFLHALQAIIELHKPKLDYVGRPQCSECLVGNSWKHWPCATIQAIQKELE